MDTGALVSQITWGYSLAGLLVGVAVGATGVGGGSLMTPILILFYGVSPAMAVGTDLLYASLSKSFGVFLHGRNGSLDWKIVGWLSLGSLPAALLMLAWMQSFGISEALNTIIKITLSIAVILTASFTLLQQPILNWVNRRRGGTAAKLAMTVRQQVLYTVISGAVVGAVVTLSSVGAGVIGMMLLLLIYPQHTPIRLVGSDLAHAVLITGIAGLGHARLGTVDYSMLLWLLVGALPGIWIGSRLGFRLDAANLKRVISAMLIVAGGMTLTKALAG